MQVTKQYKKAASSATLKPSSPTWLVQTVASIEKSSDLRRRKRRGESLSGTEGQRLNYMKNVRKDRVKKGIAGAALAGTAAAVAGPALAAQLGGRDCLVCWKLGLKGAAKRMVPKMAKAISNPNVQKRFSDKT